MKFVFLKWQLLFPKEQWVDGCFFHFQAMIDVDEVYQRPRQKFAQYSSVTNLLKPQVQMYDYSWMIIIRPSLDGTYYGMALSVRPSVRSSVRPTVSTKKHRCKWRIFFKFCTQVCLGVPSINLLFVLSYLIKYAHNSIISDFSIFGIHRVIF